MLFRSSLSVGASTLSAGNVTEGPGKDSKASTKRPLVVEESDNGPLAKVARQSMAGKDVANAKENTQAEQKHKTILNSLANTPARVSLPDTALLNNTRSPNDISIVESASSLVPE